MNPDRRMSLRFARLLVALTVVLSLLGLTPTATHAATTDVCPSGCPFSSIQAAIDAAASGDTITIKAGTYTERLSISKNLTLQGAGAGTTTINGGATGSTITIATGVTTAISGVMITGGLTTARDNGGGITNLGTLTLTNSTVSGNTAFQGAGIRNSSGATLTLTNSTVSGNTASDSDGGINNGGTATISNSTISGNNGGFGGGGIGNNGTMTVSNSTISGNSVTGVAGAIWNLGTLTVSNSTISGNSAPTAAGIFFDHATTVKNTIIASNSGPNCGFQFGSLSDGGGNLSSDASCNFTAASSLSAIGPQLDPAGLKDNGGPTNTIALLPNSPAINAGDTAACADASAANNLDQRGQPRSNDQCDIGAYEFQPSATSLSVAAAAGTPGGVVTLSATLTQAGNPVGKRQVSFTLNGAAVGSATTSANGVATLADVSLSGINPGTYSGGIEATFAAVSPFNASSGNASLTVGFATQTVTLTGVPSSATYASTFTPSASSDTGLPVTISVSGICSLSGTTVSITSGIGTCIVTANQAGNATYSAASASTNVAAQKIPLSITADTASKVYGTPLPIFTVHYDGLVSPDTSAALGGSLSCSTTATASSPVGSYPITCSGQTSDNYTITYQPGTLNITKAFPLSSVLDSFNRTNGKVGANWDGLTDQAFYKIASNTLDVQLGGPLVWKPTSFGTTQEAFVTLSTIDTKNPSQGLLLKVQTGSIPNGGAISVVYDAKAKAVRVSALRLGQNGAWTLYPNQAATFANGDVLGARAKAAGTVEIYKNGTLIATVTLSAADQAFFNAKGGKIGVWTVAASNAVLDDFGGGNVAP